MNEYEKALFDYIMINKMDKTRSRLDYILADEQEKAILEEFHTALTADQRRQFRRYEEQNSAKSIIDLEQMFTETLTAIRSLLAPGLAG